MTTILHTTFNILGVILLTTSMVMFLAAIQSVQTYLASVGWHRLESVSWNG